MTVKEVNEYDDVKMKDGKTGTVIEKYSDEDFMIDVSPSATEPQFLDPAHIDEIEKVTRKAN